MNQELRIKLFRGFAFLALFFILTILFTPFPAYAADPPCSLDPSSQIYIDYVAKYGPCPGGLNEIEGMVGNIISVIVGLGFVAMLIVLIFAGFKYLTSGGEPKAIQAAHHTFSWALLGIILMAIAWVILQLIEGVTGVKVTVFDIKALCKDGTDPLKFCIP